MYGKVYTDEEYTLSAKMSSGKLEVKLYRDDKVVARIPLDLISPLLEILGEVKEELETEELRVKQIVMLDKWNSVAS